MGNHTSRGSTRLILPDGTVREYTEPVTVAELMLDHPQQVILELNHQPVGKKSKPLGADVKLENNKVYLMVPMRRGKPAASTISSEEVRRIVLKADAVLTAYTGFIPVFARMCPAAVVKSKKKKKEEKVVEKWPAVEVTPELLVGREDGYYLTRQLSVKRSWKPSLDTIKEKGVKDKIRHWLV